METVFVVIYIVTAALVSAAVTILVLRKRSSKPNDKSNLLNEQLSQVETEKCKLAEQVLRLSNELEYKNKELVSKRTELKELIDKFESQGKVDLGTSASFAEIERLRLEIKQLADAAVIEKQNLDKVNAEIEEKDSQLQQQNTIIASLQTEKTVLETQYREIVESASKNEDEINKLKDENKKIKKELDDVQEEFEDLQDELKQTKVQFERKRTEMTALHEEKIKAEKAYKDLTYEFERNQDELRRKEESLQLNLASLDFIQHTLSAPEISDISFNELYKKIESTKNFIKDEVEGAVENIYKLDNDSKKLFNEDLNHWVETRRKSWLHRKTAIAFVGEFSAGKTSIVNNILKQGDENSILLPVSTKATTAIPTYISSGVSERYAFFSPDNKLKDIDEEHFKKVNKEVLDQIGGLSSLIQYFVMTYKNPNLENLSILDTPGFSSNDKEDAERTIGVINECDALFWVFDVNAGTVNRSSVKLIKENLHKPLYVVINKVDTKSSSEVDKVEKLIRSTLHEEGIQVEQFIRYSQAESLDVILNPIKSVKRIGEAEEYLNTVRGYLKNFASELKKDVTSKSRAKQSTERKADSLNEKFMQYLDELQEDCNEVLKIPTWTTHIFSKDRYEMSDKEYQDMQQRLNHICENILPAIVDGYEDIKALHSDIASLTDEYMEARKTFKIFDNLTERMNKHIKELNK